MWICSTFGYFSIVKSDREDGVFLVRARSTKDLEILKRETGLSNEIVVLPDTDYTARLIVTTEELSSIFYKLERSIGYSNFKSEIYRTSEQADKMDSYHGIWQIMYEYQEDRRRQAKWIGSGS